MLLEAGRDTAAMFYLDTRLGALREAHVERVLEGESPPESFFPEGEGRVLEEVEARFYAGAAEESVGGSFQDHSQKLVEYGVRWAHEILKGLPFVGQPEYRDGG